MDEYYEVIQALPRWLADPLAAVPPGQAAQIQEIRLRAGEPVVFTLQGRPCSAAQISPALAAMGRLRLTQAQIEECLLFMAGNSLHSYEDELAGGYLTLAGGHRVGVGGRYVRSTSSRTPHYVLVQARSLNLRVARVRVPALPPELRQLLAEPFGALALVGEPGSGKTTVLRGIACELKQAGRICAVVDEREELFGRRQLPPGGFCGTDIIAGVAKADAVQMALRTLAPQVILLDELGSTEEVQALRQGFAGGVDLVVTLHAGSLKEAERRPQFRQLCQSGMLRAACLLAGRQSPGTIVQVQTYGTERSV